MRLPKKAILRKRKQANAAYRKSRGINKHGKRGNRGGSGTFGKHQ